MPCVRACCDVSMPCFHPACVPSGQPSTRCLLHCPPVPADLFQIVGMKLWLNQTAHVPLEKIRVRQPGLPGLHWGRGTCSLIPAPHCLPQRF